MSRRTPAGFAPDLYSDTSRQQQLGARVLAILRTRHPRALARPWPEGYPDLVVSMIQEAARELELLDDAPPALSPG